MEIGDFVGKAQRDFGRRLVRKVDWEPLTGSYRILDFGPTSAALAAFVCMHVRLLVRPMRASVGHHCPESLQFVSSVRKVGYSSNT